MADYRDLLPSQGALSMLEAKASLVQEKAAQKAVDLDPRTRYGEDWDLLDDSSFAAKYGASAMLRRDNLRYQAIRQQAIAESGRTAGELRNDVGAGLVKGAVSAVTGVARLAAEHNLGSGLENVAKKGLLGEFARNLAQESEAQRAELFADVDRRVIDPITRSQSETSRFNAQQVAADTARDAAENARQERAAVSAGANETVAGAQRALRDIGDSFVNTISNPTTLFDSAVEQVPLLAMGPMARAAVTETAVANRASALASRMGGEQGITQALLAEARSTLQGRVMGGMVAATEAGSAYNQVSNEIMEMPTAELARRYPDVAEQLAAGADERVVRADLANRVGRTTALITAPVAGLVGRATARFELDPLSAGGAGLGGRAAGIASNVGGEMLEESLQGGSSEFAGNLAGKLAGDQEADLLDGVGTAVGQGAASALGFSGGLQAPAALGVAAEATAAGTRAALRPVGAALGAVADAKRDREQNQVREVQAAADESRRTTLGEIAAAVQTDAADTTRETPAANALVEPLEMEPLLPRETVASLQAEAPVTNRVEALSRTIDAIREMDGRAAEDVDPARSTELALFAVKTARQLRGRLGEIDPVSPEAEAISKVLDLDEVTQLEESVKQVPAETLENLLATVIDDPEFSRPKSQQAAETVAVFADVAPEKITSDMANAVALYQRLTPEQKSAIELAGKVAAVREAHQQAYAEIGQPERKTPNIVTDEVTEKGWGEKRPSLASHQNRVMTAMAKGQLGLASKAMRDLQNFARHYQNKARAYDQGMLDGAANPDQKVDIAYRTLDASGKPTDMPTAWLIPSTDGSRKLVRHIFNDANTVIATYNELASLYGDKLVNTNLNQSSNTKLLPSIDLVGEPTFLNAAQGTTNAAGNDVSASAPRDGTADAKGKSDVSDSSTADSNRKQDQASKPTDPSASKDGERGSREGEGDNAVVEKEVGKRGFIKVGKTRLGYDVLDDAVNLFNVTTPASERGKGNARRAMNQFTAGLDANDQAATLTVVPFGEDTDGKRLETFYAKAGFVATGVDENGNVKMRREKKSVRESAPTEELVQASSDERVTRFESLPNHPDGSPNWFLSAFQLKSNTQALLARIPNALRSVVQAIRAGDISPLLLESDRATINTTDTQLKQLENFVFLVPKVVDQLNKNVARAFAEAQRFAPGEGWVQKKDKNGNVKNGSLEDLVDGKATLTPGQYSLSVLEYGRDENGTPYIRYQKDVAEAMALASLMWVAKNAGAPINFSEEDESSMFPDGMSRDLKNAFRTKHFSTGPVRTIAQDIMRHLGMQGKADASVTLTDGIAKSMAMDVLISLDDFQVIRLDQHLGEDNRQLTFINLRDAKGASLMTDIARGVGSRLLTKLFDPDAQDLPTFEPSKKAPTKVSGTNQKLSAKQTKQVLNDNAVPFYRNGPLIMFKELMGDRFLELIGLDTTTDEKSVHPDHWRSIDGKNKGLRYSEDRVRDLDTMIFDRGGDADNTPLYWSHYVVSNGRVMQNGFGGQGDKWARVAISANRKTVDLSSDTTPATKDHYLAMAQSLGIKTEKWKNAAAIQKIKARLAQSEYQALFADIQSLLKNEDDASNADLAVKIQDQIQALAKTKDQKFEVTAQALHALVAHARLLQARIDGKAGEFTTFLSFELDGKTNGPFNALVHFGLTKLSTKIYDQLRKGGLFVGDAQPQVLSDHPDQGDLYQDAADALQVRFAKQLDTYSRETREGQMLRAGMRMLALAGHIKVTQAGFIVQRGIAKAALMTTTYGAGRRGVVNAMAHEIQAKLVEYLSEVAQDPSKRDHQVEWSAMQLMGERFDRNEKMWLGTPPLDFSKPAFVEFKPEHFQALVDNLLGGQKDGEISVPSGAGGLLRDIVEDEMAPVLATFRKVFAASRLQMMAFRQRYVEAYDARRKELVEKGELHPYHALSRAEEQKIFDSLKDIAPVYALPMTGGAAEQEGVFAGEKDYDGTFVVKSTNAKGQVTERNYQAESLFGAIRADINVRAFADPGVKAAPLLTIGAGDAYMMNWLYQNAMEGVLNVYDGWEVSMGDISERALQANNGVRASLESDLLGGVAKSYQSLDTDALRRAVEALSEKELRRLVFQLDIPTSRDTPVAQMVEYVVTYAGQQLGPELESTAALIRENKTEIFKRQKNSIDQMSGGENPSHRGYTTADLQPRPAPGPIEGESEELVTRLGEDYQDGLRELSKFELDWLLTGFPFTDKVRKFVVEKITHLLPDDLRVFVGTPAEIQAKQLELYPDQAFEPAQGVTYDNTIFMTVASEETLVHELVHAASLHLVQRYYAKAKGLTYAQKDAVRELEKMLEPFLALSGSPALAAAQAEVRYRQELGQPAAAINEMLAWSLANSAISGQLLQTESPGVLKKVAKTIRALVRKLLGLPQNQQIDSFLDQMAGNFQRLVRRPRLAETASALRMYQRLRGPADPAQDDHLESLLRQFSTVLEQVRGRTGDARLDKEAGSIERQRLDLEAQRVVEELKDLGYLFDDKSAAVFQLVQSVMSSNLALDPVILSELDKLFGHAAEKLEGTDFVPAGTIDEIELQRGRARHSFLFGGARRTLDRYGRSQMLANFVALAAVDPMLRGKLDGLALPQAEARGETLDDKARDLVRRGFDWLSDRSLGIGQPGNQRAHFDRLTQRLAQLQQKAALQAARSSRKSLVDRLEDKVRAGQDLLDQAAEGFTQDREINAGVRAVVQGLRGALSDEAAGANAEVLVDFANQKLPGVLVDLVSDIAGMTKSTEALHRLVNKTRHAVSRIRQQLREEAPADVRAFFSTALSEAQWAGMVKWVGQTDLQALAPLGMARLRDMVTSSTHRDAEIQSILAQLGPHRALYQDGAQELARFLITREGGPRYRNAEALARLFGQAQVGEKQAKRLTPLLDRLVSLYALEGLNQDEQAALGQLLASETDGMQKLLNTMRSLVQAEMSKTERRQRWNRWKGWVPESRDPRSNVVLANTKQAADLVKRGYKFVGFYRGDARDPATDLAYYAIDWVGGASTFNQGALQTVEGTLSGVDALTGQSLDPGLGTLVVNEGVVASIAGRKMSRSVTSTLAPIYDQDGDVVMYERVLDPAVVARHVSGQKDLALSIGIWLGRQAEENLADAMNGQVVQALKQRWVEDEKAGKADRFIDVTTSKDPVVRDTWNAIPRHTQEMLRDAFGGRVMIRRDMMRNALGYRSASVADAFTGVSNLPGPVRKAIVDAAYILPFVDFKVLVAAEKALQGAVGTAKDWIVVRSGIVAIANGVANMFQLTASGINPLQLPKLIARKAQETELYLRNEKRLSRIRVELTAVRRPDERNKLLLERQRLLDANARLSIAPLIFAGELPTIAEGLSEHDEYSLTGDFMKWVEKKSEKLPQGVLTAGKIAAISKDTALYQGMNRLVQFGDFTAKAVLYDKWIQDGMSPEDALAKISERFVNYNLNAGRTRDYLESMGLLWFWNYKLRVQKIVLATLRENPLRFLLSVTGADLVNSDSLLTSSAPFVYWDYSIGPDQLFRAPEATLWHQLFG